MKQGATLKFATDDKLGLEPFCQKLERFLIIEHSFVEGSLTVSLNAPFGAGKTTFLQMWKTSLDERRKAHPDTPHAILLNAWESDYCGDPLLAIVADLIEAAKPAPEAADTPAGKRLREAAKDVAWFTLGLANKVAANWSGVDPLSAAKLAEDKKKERNPKPVDFLQLYKDRKDALQNLKDSLAEVFGGEKPRALIFVDELDRCRPDYAVTYLETIKHVFDVHGLAFVLAIDYEHLESSARALFGEDLVFAEYLRKFVHRSFDLPRPSEAGLRSLAQAYARAYMEKEGIRVTFLGDVRHRVENCVELMGALGMSPRQVQEAFRTFCHAVTGNDEKRGNLRWGFGVGTILMASLKVTNRDLYQAIGTQRAKPLDVGRFLVELLGKQKGEWWFTIYVLGAGTPASETPGEPPGEKLKSVFVSLGFLPEGKELDARKWAGFGDCWGYAFVSGFKTIYETIEGADFFGNQR